ncbi:hypothetical protein GCM10009527_076400 [Actinomadura nitritigenes]
MTRFRARPRVRHVLLSGVADRHCVLLEMAEPLTSSSGSEVGRSAALPVTGQEDDWSVWPVKATDRASRDKPTVQDPASERAGWTMSNRHRINRFHGLSGWC